MKNLFAIIIAVLALAAVYTILNDQTSLFGKENKSGDSIAVTKGVKVIDLRLESGETDIIPTDQDEVKVEIDGTGKLTLTERGDTIQVKVKHKWYQWIAFNKKSDITVYIPKSYDRDLNIELGSGEAVFDGGSESSKMTLDELTVEMGSGDLDLSNLDTAVFKHKGSSGDVTIDELKTLDGKVDLSSGDVDIMNYEGPLSGDVSSGRLTVMMKSLTGDVSFDVSSGDVDLDLPDDASFTLNGHASSGNVSTSFPLKDRKKEDGDLSGKAGTGEYRIDASVSSGSVEIH
ncbi:DUF4097 domain-containing protein [Rossellomorea aquimaris]|uniref:LiaG family protein n=1 Tax=Rossellomorea aquimaris TaxID=189382 RepID=UPI001CD6D204|nr:DUF4097 family beta strand repeat-containing protein [Rossellomorea aquimaris]MCA1057037.1 DUF4097 domain-containing protein [Rossellomorea aquimaris]